MKIAVLAFDGMTLFHLSTPLLVAGEVAFRRSGRGWATTICSLTGEDIVTDEGVRVSVQGRLADVLDADCYMVPAWGNDLPPVPAELTRFLRERWADGAMLMGLCLGAFVLCEAGVLDGRAATTHWACGAELQSRFPTVDVKAEALYIDHGDVMTSAGTAAALDACLHLVRRELGADIAAQVAAQLVIAPHREGNQTQHVVRQLPQSDSPDRISELLEFIDTHLEHDLSVDALARRVAMSGRHLTRRFVQVTGVTPAVWVKQRRLDAARRLLESTQLSIAQVSEQTGFHSTATFRQAFVKAFATSPLSYRQRFTR